MVRTPIFPSTWRGSMAMRAAAPSSARMKPPCRHAGFQVFGASVKAAFARRLPMDAGSPGKIGSIAPQVLQPDRAVGRQADHLCRQVRVGRLDLQRGDAALADMLLQSRHYVVEPNDLAAEGRKLQGMAKPVPRVIDHRDLDLRVHIVF